VRWQRGPILGAPLRRARAPAAVVASTVVAALMGWLLLVIGARLLGADGYARFAVFWAFYFALAGLLLGVQQETARSVSRAREVEVSTGAPLGSRVLPPALLLVGLAAVALAATSPAWAPGLLGEDWLPVLALSIVGFLSLTVQSTILGSLAARQAWASFTSLTVAASAIRLAVVLAVCLLLPTDAWLVLGIASGSAAWVVFVASPEFRTALVAQGEGMPRKFVAGATSTMVGSLFSGLLATGFPVLVSLTSDVPLDATAGVVFAAVMVTRTPLLMPVNALQLMMITYFVRGRDALWHAAARIVALAVAMCVPFVLLAGVIGPWALELVLGPEFRVPGTELAWLVTGATLLVILTITGTALIAVDHHVASAAGWGAAVLVTCLLLGLDADLMGRTIVALIGGPAAGICVHLASGGTLRTSARRA
jgi:O-antigen/teichoic acid export membrane protein